MSEYEWLARRAKEAGHPRWDTEFWMALEKAGLLKAGIRTRRTFQMLLFRYDQYREPGLIGPPISPN
jgi:hypothetical protein